MTALIVSVTVGALIGWGTNLIAILMLFRPWQEHRLFGVKVPLTPGLIPKRQPEIAQKLGEIVEEHLLTEEGIIASLNRPEWLEEMRSRILEQTEAVLADERTIGHLLAKLTGRTVEELFQDFEKWARTAYETTVLPQLCRKKLEDLLPSSLRASITMRVDKLAGLLLEKTQDWIDSPDGRRFLADTIQQRLLDGGMLGKMAVMFVKEDKLVEELIPQVKKMLESPATFRFLQEKLQSEWQFLLERNVGDVASGFAEAADVGQLAQKLIDFDLYELFLKNRSRMVEFLEDFLMRMKRSAAAWVTPVLRVFGIRRIVEEQVASFSLLKLEKLIIGVVKKELQMITWLGALLGGLIGLIQALLIMGWQ
ncbi:DUF445 family protein [Effusibacillus consociatus]|uniref:DUF445 family protein n=1 Tax=Effusibacillus consociatus TaxID=1117041 RepID=A0ABV9Q040_9BACL